MQMSAPPTTPGPGDASAKTTACEDMCMTPPATRRPGTFVTARDSVQQNSTQKRKADRMYAEPSASAVKKSRLDVSTVGNETKVSAAHTVPS